MAGEKKLYRLVTRSDFDGLVCAVLLKEKGLTEVDKILPRDKLDEGTF